MSGLKLSVQNLSKDFLGANNKLQVLSNLSLHVGMGEFVSILGPSGCGKSTLLNIVAGVEEPSSGGLMINSHSERLGQSGYMLQKPLLLPWMTVRENAMLSLLIQRQPLEAAKRKADKLLTKFGLIDFVDHYPATLSGGMAQKVAMARTVLANKDFLLMDEPFGSLDAVTRLSMQMWLLSIWDEVRPSILFITHDIREAVLLSDRIYVLSKRPATILKEVTIKLPRPRRREHLSRQSSVKLESELESMLLAK